MREAAIIAVSSFASCCKAERIANRKSKIANTMSDLKFAFRQLAGSRGFTIVAVFSLALGIGASTAVFSLYNAIVLRSLPVPNPQALRIVQWGGSDVRMSSFEGKATVEGTHWTGADCVTHPTFLRLRAQAAPQAELFGFCPIRDSVVGLRGEVFVSDGMMVSDHFFAGLEVRPYSGRCLREGEDFAGAMNVVVSYGWWQQHYGPEHEALGQALLLNGTTYTIVGVLPKGFTGVQPGRPADFYVPMSAGSPFLYAPIAEDWHWFVRLVARLKPGATDGQLRAALEVAFAEATKQTMQQPRIVLQPGFRGTAYDRNTYGKTLRLLLGAIALVLLVACANLAGLSLARGAARQHELAVRAALGAGRWRLIRQVLTESLMIGLVGGCLGVLLALWGRTSLARLLAGTQTGLRYDYPLDSLVLGFTVAITFMTAVASGLLPALRAGQVDPLASLKSRGTSSPRRLRFGRILVAGQICLAMLLLAGAGLYTRSLVNLAQINAGFKVEHLLVLGLNIRAGTYAEAHPAAFYERLLDQLASTPGVQSAALSGFPLLADDAWTGGFGIRERHLDSQAQSCRLTVSEAFFSTLGIPILQGRGLEAIDTAEAPRAVVVNEKFRQRYLPGEDPVGLTFTMLGLDWRIVGVCGNAKYDNIKKPVEPTVYLPFRQMFFKPSISKNLTISSIAVRSALPPSAISAAVRRVMAQIDPGVAITTVTTQKALRDQGIGQEHLLAALSGLLAVLTVLLSCIGLYSLMAYNVQRRANEIAVRMAIGAQPGKVALVILREALTLAAVGIGFGLPAIFACTRFIRSQLYGVQPHDPLTLLGVTLALLVVVAIAAWIPARRAARVDPAVALRME